MTKDKRKKYIKPFLLSLVFMIVLGFSNINVMQVFASEEMIEEIFISEDNYSDTMKAVVEPYLAEIAEEGYFLGEEEANIYYRKYLLEDSKGSIVISHGYCEYMERHSEMIYYFLKSGYSVFALEHRGHSRSGLLGSDDSQVSVENFDYYVEDFKTFIDEIVIPSDEEKELFLFAHSMGGAVGTRFIQEYPEYFTSAVLSAPMMEVHTGDVPAFAARAIANIMNLIGKGSKYVLGEGPYTGDYYYEGSGTGSQARYDYFYELIVENEEYQRGGASYSWLKQAFRATKEITNKKNASSVETPILLFQAENDTYVKPEGQNIFAKYAQNCELVFVENSKHEIYRESDEILKPYLIKILEFYEENN